jgi:Transcriptional regulatory protein, C terminal
MPRVLNSGHVQVPVSVSASSRTVRFSTFEVNFHTGELRKRGRKIKLQEQPLQVLAALLERPGELVTREELRSKLWPADAFVDFVYHLEDFLEIQFFETTSEGQGSRVFGSPEQTTRPPAVEKRLLSGVKSPQRSNF